MNKILLFAITLLLPIGLNAQTNYLQDKVAEYYTESIEQKIKMDSIYQPFADMYKKRQIKSIANIPFGTSLEKAEPILRNKFGTPQKIPGKMLSYLKTLNMQDMTLIMLISHSNLME